MITFLEGVLILFGLYILTQVFLPYLLGPTILPFNWLFKSEKTKNLEQRARDLKREKEQYLEQVADVKEKGKQELENAKETNKFLKSLK